MNDEQAIRRHPVCCGCGGQKNPDDMLLVCWGCFKHCTAPYKYAELSLVAWVAAGGPVAWLSETRPIHQQPQLLATLMQPVKPPSVLVRVNSHRARGKLHRLLGYQPPEFYHGDFKHPGSWNEIPASDLHLARKIKGVTKARIDAGKLRPCIDWGWK